MLGQATAGWTDGWLVVLKNVLRSSHLRARASLLPGGRRLRPRETIAANAHEVWLKAALGKAMRVFAFGGRACGSMERWRELRMVSRARWRMKIWSRCG
jgi:hypothetical protein